MRQPLVRSRKPAFEGKPHLFHAELTLTAKRLDVVGVNGAELFTLQD